MTIHVAGARGNLRESGKTSVAAKCLRTLSGLFSPNLIDQSSCWILTTHAKIRPILHDDWSIRLGENRLDKALKHLTAILVRPRVRVFFIRKQIHVIEPSSRPSFKSSLFWTSIDQIVVLKVP